MGRMELERMSVDEPEIQTQNMAVWGESLTYMQGCLGAIFVACSFVCTQDNQSEIGYVKILNLGHCTVQQ